MDSPRAKPSIIILAGPNGAGKSTAAPRLLRGLMDIKQFVNADVIAQGLSGFGPDSVAYEASAIMLDRMNRFAPGGSQSKERWIPCARSPD